MVLTEQGNQVYGLNYNAESMIYTLCFFMNEDANYYEMEFSTKTTIAEFEEFGEEAWYLDSKWKKH